ncbi:hypothetical protein [Burkholderia sp. IDO3]|uniref:hypothetical protein n=1 Tax=Burkholderia sp. IDO3 TaxID=1705310 RepID=UPI001F07F0D5|nr:hypothetical protein [Burkholderia sp. IDO3]
MTATAGTSVAGAVRELVGMASQRAGFASASLPQQAATLQQYQTEAATRGTDPDQAAAVKQLEQIHTASVAAYKADPWNAALDRGVLQGVPQVDTSSVPNLVTSLTSRAQSAGAVEQAAGRRVSLLTPDEAEKTLTAVDALPIDTKAQAEPDRAGVRQCRPHRGSRSAVEGKEPGDGARTEGWRRGRGRANRC